jgi:dTDP-4-amino-4,6-dideoxygalactose transaminase
MSDKPAVLGAKPAFDDMLAFVRPTLPPLEGELLEALQETFETGMLTKGKYLKAFEERMAEYLGVRHAVGVSSCTLGLLLTYQGLGLKGEVIVPSFTFMATVHPLTYVGVKPVFADIDPETWNIDPDNVEKLITEHTSGIVAVHNFGNPAPVAELEDIARRHNLRLIFDAAHGYGASYRGRPVGSFGDAEVFSSSPTKLLVTAEGGIVATNNDDLAEHVRKGREYGNPGDYSSDFPGLNARMPEFNALMGLKSLEMLEQNAENRNRLVGAFKEGLDELPGITLQKIRPEDRCSYKDFSITIDSGAFGLTRDQVAKALKAENIDTRHYHDPAVHTHKPYVGMEQADLPVTERVAGQSLSLPIWSHMTLETVERICAAIARIQDHAEEVKEVLGG